MQYANSDHAQRLNRALDYIDTHLSEPLSLEQVSSQACYSPYHFHRIFKATMGETLNRYIQRLRVEKAAASLLMTRTSITEIALACGFSCSAAFARTFKEHYGISAGTWRSGQGKHKSKIHQRLRNIPEAAAIKPVYTASKPIQWRIYMNETLSTTVRIEELEPMEVAYLRHMGPYQGNEELFSRLFTQLFAWAGPRGLINFPKTRILSVYHDNEPLTDDDKLRLSVCMTVPEETPAEGEVGRMRIEGGTYAIAPFTLEPKEYVKAWDMVFSQWFPASGYQSDDRPCFEVYLNSPDDHPEGKHEVEIHIPVKPL